MNSRRGSIRVLHTPSIICAISRSSTAASMTIDRCTAALRLDPALSAARNNLGLAFAASGRLDLARAQFLDAGDHASGLYNTGIAYLASGDERNALAAFDAASRARPTFYVSRVRAALIRVRLSRTAVDGRGLDNSGQ